MAAQDAAAAAFGLVIDAPEPEACEIWAELLPAVRLFEALMSQWRVGAGGRTGLDYAAIPATARLVGIKGRALREAFDGLRVMEGEALRWFRERRASP